MMKKSQQTTEVEAQKCASLKRHKVKEYAYLFISLFIFVVLITCSLTQISLANGLATQGITLSKIQDQIDATKQENMLLAEQLYTASSYTHIASQAATLGFVEAKPAIFLHGDAMPLASR